MTTTPERRNSTGNGGGLVFGSQRRYSRAYDQPIVQQTSKGPIVRVESEDTQSEASAMTGTSDGQVLNPEASSFSTYLAQVCLAVFVVVGALAGLGGRELLVGASQLFGFMFLFLCSFVVCSGLFMWWGVWNKNTINLNVKKVIIVYSICTTSDLIGRLVTTYASIPAADSLPFNTSYYVFLATLLFATFALFAHRDGLNGMFSQEVCLFVGLSCTLNFTSWCLFGDIVPGVLLPQLVYMSIMMGLTLSLVGYRFPHISLSAIYWALTNPSALQRSHRRVSSLRPSTLSTRKMSALSDVSSGIRPKTNSHSSMSSMFSMNPFLGMDTDAITEAHGLVADLLITKESLDDVAQQKLKRVRELLAPRLDKMVTLSPKVYVGNKIVDDHDYESDISSYPASELSSSQTSSSNLHLKTPPNLLTPRKTRSSSVILRRSSSRFSTTTTASGMPVLDDEPVDRRRTLALRDVRARISVQEKRHSVHRIMRDRSGSHDGKFQTLNKHSSLEVSPLAQSGTRSPISDSEVSSETSSRATSTTVLPQAEEAYLPNSAAMETMKDGEGGGVIIEERQPVAILPQSPKQARKALGSNALDMIEEGDEQLLTVPVIRRPRSHTDPGRVELRLSPASRPQDIKEEEEPAKPEGSKSNSTEETSNQIVPVSSTVNGKVVFNANQRPPNGYVLFSDFKQPPLDFDLLEYSEYDKIEVFEKVATWDFPIFELEVQASDHILSHMAFVLFREAGLMETFRVPLREFVNYFRALEANYGCNVYHNKTHAADVLHAVSYLLFEIIPEFSHEFANDGGERERKSHLRMKNSGGNIASAFSVLEVFACYMAAAMHDFDHPGRTNAFLVAMKSPLAILYNDRSVLENHHAAASWDLLNAVPENNFLINLDDAELKRLRFLIVEAILATDLKMHFDILSEWKAKVNPETGNGIDWSSEVDRLLVMKMIIKMADINTPAKSFDLHRSWTKRITEEFYQQSDEESALGLPGTIFMDRKHQEKLPAIQLSFIQHLVSPLYQSCAEAGIIPGILEETATPPSDSPQPLLAGEGFTKTEGESSEGIDEDGLMAMREEELDDAFALEAEAKPKKKFMSIILTNLHTNYEAWRAELPPEEDNSKAAVEDREKEDKDEDTMDSEMQPMVEDELNENMETVPKTMEHEDSPHITSSQVDS